VSQAPETNKIAQGLSREDLFFVTAEHFVTDTAAYADIVLPATMAGEHDDMMFSWGHFYLTINEQAIEPRGEAKSNAEIFRLLAAAMGFEDTQFKMSDRELAEGGDFEGLARVTDDVREGVIVATLGYWRSLNRSDGSVNSISSAEFCGLGRAPTISDNLVQVARVN
jgi:anaerobic selenocysteine-containing dehydrogenase